MKWLDSIPYSLLVPIALLMALLPFQPEPHLFGKLNMLVNGELNQPLDIFDLFWHVLPTILLALKLYGANKTD